MDGQAITGRVRAAYDRIAPDFAARNAGMPAEYSDVLGPRLLRAAGRLAAPAPVRVLDVGCGAGRDMAWLEAQGASVVGVDLSAGMLAQARPRARGPLLQMDMRRLAFASGLFHAVWCSASLLHLPKADAPFALAEMRRVLVPGGVLMVALHAGEGEGWEPSAYAGPVERFFARYTLEEAEALLASTGFAVHERGESAAGTRRWLRFLATRPFGCG